MLHSDYPLQALLYCVVLHRFLRWRQPGYDPARHLGGVLYLFVRGMCGPDTPVTDGHPGRGVRLAAAGRAGDRAVGSARRPARRRVTVTASTRRTIRGLAAQRRRRPACCATFNDAGVHRGRRCAGRAAADRAGRESDERVALAVAFVVRAVRGGSVCVDLADVAQQVGDRRSAVAGRRRMAGRGGRKPADRPTRRCCTSTAACSTSTATGSRNAGSPRMCSRWPAAAQVGLGAGHRPALPGQLRRTARGGGGGAVAGADRADRRPGHRQDHHRRAAAGAAGRTGRTRRQAAAADRAGRPDRQGRGPAAGGGAAGGRRTRLRPTATGCPRWRATTLHRLLGSRPDTSSRFRHNRDNRLPHDVIVVDETSMVSLTMMARLLEAVRPDSRLLLVGDPDQLASVEAGAVLADLVDGLTAVHRQPGRPAGHPAPVRRVDRRAGRCDPRRRRRRRPRGARRRW